MSIAMTESTAKTLPTPDSANWCTRESAYTRCVRLQQSRRCRLSAGRIGTDLADLGIVAGGDVVEEARRLAQRLGLHRVDAVVLAVVDGQRASVQPIEMDGKQGSRVSGE